MRDLTQRQLAVLNFIRAFIAEEAMPPTVGEIARRFGVTTSSAFTHVVALQKKGMLTRSSKARSIRIQSVGNLCEALDGTALIPYYEAKPAHGCRSEEAAFPGRSVIAMRLPPSCVERIPKEFGMRNDDIAFLAPMPRRGAAPPRELVVWKNRASGRMRIFSLASELPACAQSGDATSPWFPVGVLVAFQRPVSVQESSDEASGYEKGKA